MIATYEERIGRVRTLTRRYPFAAEVLAFYERVCIVQGDLSEGLRNALREKPSAGALRERIDIDLVVPYVADAVRDLAAASPAMLSAFFKEFLQGSTERWASSLQRYVDFGGTDEATVDSREELITRILIEPYAEFLAAQITVLSSGPSGNLCARCNGRPVTGVLRIEGDGGKRFLKCAFCGSEWEFRRIYCAYCGEEREASLPVYVAEKFPHIRVEACDTCRHCLRTVDLTRDGNAVPEVDDLAAIPLALWAEEHGYERIHRNLLGT
jgi:hypothetical protein